MVVTIIIALPTFSEQISDFISFCDNKEKKLFYNNCEFRFSMEKPSNLWNFQMIEWDDSLYVLYQYSLSRNTNFTADVHVYALKNPTNTPLTELSMSSELPFYDILLRINETGKNFVREEKLVKKFSVDIYEKEELCEFIRYKNNEILYILIFCIADPYRNNFEIIEEMHMIKNSFKLL